ncbi:MAG: hypothetical protein NWQ87_06000, partial [Litorivicinaceae bacterium]|nr:hypothetical protein [Litorivicinaceae bacterium]
MPATGNYFTGQNLDFTVNFSENVTVNTGGGTPRIPLTIGSSTVYASYLSGSGTSAVVFRYTVQSSDQDSDGIAVGASIEANGGTLRDSSANDATLTLNSVGSTASVIVNPLPTITSVTYNAGTGTLVVTGTNMTAASGAVNDISVSKLTLTGEAGNTYTLTSSDVEIDSSTQFTVTLNATDQLQLSGLLNKDGVSSGDSTTYNLAAADDWAAGASSSANIADLSGNLVTVSNVQTPTITSATYDAASGVLLVSGTNIPKKPGSLNDISVSKLTLTGEGGATYSLTTTDVEVSASTSFAVTLNAIDQQNVTSILNKNGTSSTGFTTYNLAAAEDWAGGAAASSTIADTTGNGVTVSNVPVPTITSATYDASTGNLVVTGTGLSSASGANNDIDVSKLTLTGEGGATYTLTSSNVEITSSTSFAVTLNATDKTAVASILNKDGTSSTDSTTYNLAAAEDWARGADLAVNIVDSTGNGVTVSNALTLDSDATVTAGVGAEASSLDSTIDTVGEAVDLFDITLSDGGGTDGLATSVSQIVFQVSGTVSDADRAKITWRLNGPDASNVTGTYSAGADTLTFGGLSISIADGGSETYVVNGYFNDNTGLTDGQTLLLSVDGDTDLTVGASGTQMAASTAVTNGSGFSVSIVASQLAFTTAPAGSVSGVALTTQPVVAARDAFGNTDADFTETVTLTEASAGSLSGKSAAAVSGVATFTTLTYTATADQQSFTLRANDQDVIGTDLATVNAPALTSDVVATELAFTTQPAPTSLSSGVSQNFTTVPVVKARDANGVVDTGYSSNIVLSVTDPNDGTLDGTVNSLTGTGDADGSGTTVTLTPSLGTATFAKLAIDYTNSGASNTLALRATSGGLTAVNSTSITSTFNAAPTLSGGPATLTSTDEDTPSSATTVAAVLSGAVAADGDSNTLGLVVTAVTGNGTWQYSTDGTTWTGLGTVSTSAGAVLSSTTQIRYVPDGVAGETPTLTFVAWDGTSGSASVNGAVSTADTTTNGGTTAFSTGTAQAQITVTDVNDAPTVALALVDQTGEVGTAFSYAFAAGSFADVDAEQS